jgi:CBS-domain-containing membrane protein
VITIRRIIVAFFFCLLLLSVLGCARKAVTPTQPSEEVAAEPTTPDPTGEASADTVSEGISDVDNLDEDLDISDLEDLDTVLDELDW